MPESSFGLTNLSSLALRPNSAFEKNKIKYSLLRQELIDSLPVGVVLALVSQGPLLLFPLWLKATGCCPELPRRQSKTNKGEKVLGCRHAGINTETCTNTHTPVDTPVNKEEFDIVCTHLLAKTVKLCTCVCAVSPSHTCTQQAVLNSSFSRLFALSALASYMEPDCHILHWQPAWGVQKGGLVGWESFQLFSDINRITDIFQVSSGGTVCMKYKYIFMTDNKNCTGSHPVLSLGRVQGSLCVKAAAFVPEDSMLCDKSC